MLQLSLSFKEEKRFMKIIERLKQLVASERKITSEIIEHIQEIDRKKIFLQVGHPTLFSFLTEHIGYSASAAQRRIEAARLLTAVPEVSDEIKSGGLNLSQVALVAQSIRQKQKETPTIEFKSEDKKMLLLSIKNQNYETSQKIISHSLDLEIKAVDRKTIQKDESVRLEVTFTKSQMATLHKVKSLMSHTNPSASVAEVFEHLAQFYLKRKDLVGAVGKTKVSKEPFEIDVCNTKSMQQNTESVMKTQYNRKPISVRVKRFVWTRDHGRCQHLNLTTGKKCSSNYLLEIDHIKRRRHGGDNHPSNLRLLCKAHNLWRG